MTLEDEVLFLIQTKKDGDVSGQSLEEFKKRLNQLYLRGQVTDAAYNIVMLMYSTGKSDTASKEFLKKFKPIVEAPKESVSRVSDPCGRSTYRSSGC